MLNIGIVGLGQIACDKMIPAIEASDKARIVALSEVRMDHLHEVGGKLGIKHLYSQYTEMLRHDNIDVIYIATPNYLHAQQVTEALEAGKHVLCEKPMAVNAEEATRMVDTARRTGRKLAIGYVNRWNPVHFETKRIYQSGMIGRPLMVRSHFSFIVLPERLKEWRFDPTLSGGGPLLDIGVHHFDMIRHILELEIAEFRSFLGWCQGWSVSDAFVMSGLLSDGTPFVIDSSYDFKDMSFEIIGSAGNLRARDAYSQNPIGSLVVETTSERHEPDLGLEGLPHYWAYLQEIEDFCECILNDRESINSALNGLRDMQIIEAIHEQNLDRR